MKDGKFQQVKAGTVDFFKSMKYLVSFLLLFSLFTLTMCSTVKSKTPTFVVNDDVIITDSSSTSMNDLDTIFEEVDGIITDEVIEVKSKKIYFQETPQEKVWVDSVYNSLSFNEKLGQLFMIAAYSNKDEKHIEVVDKLVKEYKVGGLIFFQGGPIRQAKLTNRFQSNAKVPLFIGIDAEWGLSMRLDSTAVYPWNMTLGAIANDNLITRVGEQMGKECKRMGIHFNFSPVIDINTNPLNPIIGNRSFGEDKFNVTAKASSLIQGIQSQGVFATGKHFPGHGDTSTDSHHSLPIVNFSKDRLNNVELHPYRELFKEGLASVMVAHLSVPSIEPRVNYPSSLSYNIVTNILQKELDFKGLIFTDALNMKGASNFKKPGEIDLEAFLAGNDILLFAEDVPKAIEKITEAYKNKTVTDERIAKSVKKILAYKYRIGLNEYKPIDLKNLYEDLNPIENNALQFNLYEDAVTLTKNSNNLLPIKDLTKKIAYVKLGDDTNMVFVETLKKYTEVTTVSAPTITELNAKLKKFDIVIVGFHKSDKPWKNHDFTNVEVNWLNEIAINNDVILDVFAKPYSLLKIKSFSNIESVLLSYQNNKYAHQVSAQIIFGVLQAKGKLPVSVGNSFAVNTTNKIKTFNRLGFTVPENVGMSSKKLDEIEVIANKAINGGMAPGMQILVARKGKVIYQKSFGYHTYEKKNPVLNSDIYDVASITKIVATLPNLMRIYDKGKINLNTRLGEILKNFKETNKDSITIQELLSHNSGLQAWIPFYKATLDSISKKPIDSIYSKFYSKNFSVKVVDSLFIRNDYHDVMINQIIASNLSSKKTYKYSDLAFIIFKEYIEKSTNLQLDELSEKLFYRSLGMNNTMFNPLKKFDVNSIPPTEIDNYFRYSIVQGYVHDMAAAMDGGVGGHAGVFSNAMDIAKMMQMFLNGGFYGDRKYFSKKTFETFNTCYFCLDGNRRGLGFDKPQLGKEGPTCGCVSSSSFGHTGFTGTIAWADPKTELIYVFLSNRTYPDSNASNKLSKSNIREDIQKIIQEAILDK